MLFCTFKKVESKLGNFRETLKAFSTLSYRLNYFPLSQSIDVTRFCKHTHTVMCSIFLPLSIPRLDCLLRCFYFEWMKRIYEKYMSINIKWSEKLTLLLKIIEILLIKKPFWHATLFANDNCVNNNNHSNRIKIKII